MATQRDAPLDFGAITLESLDVAAIARDLLGSEELARNGRSARTLAKGKGMTAVLTAVRAGGEIHEHVAPGPVVIVPVTGAVTVEGLEKPSISHAGLGPDAIHRTRQKAPGFGRGRCRVPLAYRIPVLRRRWGDGGGCAPQKVTC